VLVFSVKKREPKKRKRGVGISVLLMTAACRVNGAAFLLVRKTGEERRKNGRRKQGF
jgi:hypothetical protein